MVDAYPTWAALQLEAHKWINIHFGLFMWLFISCMFIVCCICSLITQVDLLKARVDKLEREK